MMKSIIGLTKGIKSIARSIAIPKRLAKVETLKATLIFEIFPPSIEVAIKYSNTPMMIVFSANLMRMAVQATTLTIFLY